MRRISAIAILAAILSLVGGCAAFNRMSVTQQRNTTMGQELIDLGKAKEAGLISAAEYARARELVLKWAEPMEVGSDSASCSGSASAVDGTK